MTTVSVNNSNTSSTHGIVFIDPAVDDYQTLVNGVIPEAEVIVLDPNQDGVLGIAQALQGRSNITSVHIVSHGSPGCLYLGNTQLCLDSLHHYAPQLQTWFTPSTSPSLLLYGCNVAAGDAGAEFIAKLQALTGAEIAASKSLTGSAAKGGNWELEVTTAQIQPALALQPEAMANYSYVLDVKFSLGTAYQVGEAPLSVVSGDFNGDGKQDLATANFTSKNVSVMLGNGNGTFKTATNYGVGTGTGTYDITTGDLNGDGRLDLAVTNRDSNNISILLGNGDGTFGAATNYNISSPYSVVVSDFNNDGSQDLAVGSGGSSNISILLGNGNGTFGAATSVNIGQYAPLQVTVGDFNGDGNKDLATANYWGTNNQGNISILLGNGNGTFGSPTTYIAGTQGSDWSNSPRPFGIQVGDFNKDGKQDLAVANQGTQQISILLGNGNGTFGTATNYANVFGDQLTIGDFDGDGIQDLATSSLNVLLGKGDGTFGTPTSFSSGSTNSIATGDFNGDSRLDLVSTRYSNDAFVLLNDFNKQPTDISLSNTSINENLPANTIVGTFSTTDPNTSDTFTYSLVTGEGSTDNSAFSIVGNQLRINASPDFETKNNYSIRVRTTDQGGLSYEEVVTVNVNNLNDAPALTGTQATLSVGSEDIVYTISQTDLLAGFSDVEGDTLSVSNLTASNGSLVNNNNGTWSFTPTANFNDAVNLNYNVTDGNGGSPVATQSFPLTAVNDAPTVANPITAQTASAYTPFNFQFAANTFNDVDTGDSLTYNATLDNGSALPSWLSFDAAARTFSGISTDDEASSLNILVTASDTSGSSISNTFALNIALPQNTTTNTINGDSGNNVRSGGAANDLINGGAGNDTLNGNGGDDNLNGGDGKDLLRGGVGKDILNGGVDNDTLYGDEGDDTLVGSAGIDILRGGVGDDILDGGADNDTLYGDAGNDTLFGGIGIDILRGGDADDILRGGAGNDTLYGDAGNDILFGGSGNDMIWGGAGNDQFVLALGQGYDTIRDFTLGQDLLSLGASQTFAQLTISQTGLDTSIGVSSTGEVLAKLTGVQASLITASDFTV